MKKVKETVASDLKNAFGKEVSNLNLLQGGGDSMIAVNDMASAIPQNEEEEIIKVAIVGKPNVGKSSLFNKLAGEERSIVSDVSGTTRDTINTRLQRHGQVFELIDTAGLRRKSKVQEEVERFSNIRTTYSIAACDVAVLMVDATAEEIYNQHPFFGS